MNAADAAEEFRMQTRRRVMTLLAAASVPVGSVTATAQAAVTPDGWYTVAAANSGKCVDARAAGSVNGIVVQQYSGNRTSSAGNGSSSPPVTATSG